MDEKKHHSEDFTKHSGVENPPLFKRIDSEDFKDLYDTKKLFQGIQRHLFLILFCMVIFSLLGGFATYKFLTIYKADAVVIYQGEDRSTTRIEGGFILSNLSMPTVLEMIKIPRHFDAVKAMLGLDLESGEIGGMVTIPTPRNDSNLIHIVVKGDNPNLVVDVVNSLVKAAVKTSQEFTRNQLRIALDGYQSQLAIARRALEIQIQEIEDFKTTHKYFEMDPQHATLIAQVENIRQRSGAADLRHNGLLIEYENLKKEVDVLPNYVPISMESKGSPLQVRIVSLETTLAQARAKYTKDNPKLKQLEQELYELHQKSNRELTGDSKEEFYEKNEVKGQLELELMHMQGKVRSSLQAKEQLSGQLEALAKSLDRIPVEQMAFVKLLQSKSTTEEQLQFLNKALDTAQLMINTPRGSIDLYQLAKVATPWKDSLWVDLLPMLGLFFGLGVGIIFALFLEAKDKKIRTAKQLEMFYSIPCIGEIPELGSLGSNNGEKTTLFYVRGLAERLEKKFRKSGIEGHTSLTVTSSVFGEGKSCFSYYLARYFSRLDKRVLLLEFDSRQNSFTAGLQKPEASLVDYLKGEESLEVVTVEGKPDRIVLKTYDPDVKELIKSKKMASLWEDLKRKYDLIIIDSPGLIEDDYAANLTLMTDFCVLLVGSSVVNKTTVDETLTLLDEVGARPCGIVLNRIKPIYITNERIKLETKRKKKEFLKELLLWKK